MSRQRICSVAEIPDGDSAAFTIETEDGFPRDLMAIRKDGQVYAYYNTCPHVGSPLDFVPGQFLDADKEYIFCSSHGAMFQIQDGYCVWGPCAGEGLIPLKVEVEGEDVYVTPA